MWEVFLTRKDKESILKRSNTEGDFQSELGFVHVENQDDPKGHRGIQTQSIIRRNQISPMELKHEIVIRDWKVD